MFGFLFELGPYELFCRLYLALPPCCPEGCMALFQALWILAARPFPVRCLSSMILENGQSQLV